MKKIIYFASAACILAIAVSCQNDIYENTVPEEAVVFTGIIDNSPATRTSLDDSYYVSWTAGDEVYIAGTTSGTTFTAKSTGTSTSFTSTSGSVEGTPYTAIYPASYYKSGSYVMPASLTYASGSFNVPMYGFVASPSTAPTTLTFKNVFSVLKITVPRTVMVKAVAVGSSSDNINGTFTISDNCAVIASGDKTTTLNCDVDGKGKGIPGTDFYIPVPAGNYTGNLTVTITTVGESTTGSASKTTTKTISMSRNTIYGLSGIIKEGSFSLNNGSTLSVISSDNLL